MSDRGMKKWAPFSSLVEQATCLEEMKYQRNKIQKPRLTEDQMEKINSVLQNYKKGDTVHLKFYRDGYLYVTDVQIKRIDLENRILVLDKGKIKMSDIIDLDNDEVF